MIYSLLCWNPETKSLGNWVDTLEESDVKLDARRVVGGDLNPDTIRVAQEKFFESLKFLKV